MNPAKAAGIVGYLAAYPTDWVERRVEHVRFIDDRVVERRVSVDFTLPDEFARFRDPLPFVPIALLKKRPLRALDVRDEQGKAIPVLSRRQNGDVASMALERLAGSVLGAALGGGRQQLAEDLLEDLRTIAIGQPRAAAKALEQIEVHRGVAARRLLSISPAFMGLAESLVENFLLLAVVTRGPGQRSLLKYQYEEHIGRERSTRRGRAAEAFGWSPLRVAIETPGVTQAKSYHIELDRPAELEICSATLSAEHEDGWGINEADPHPKVRAHLYVSDVPAGATGSVRAAFRVRRSGFLHAALATALLTEAVLGVTLGRLTSTTSHADGAVTLLALVPAILVSYLIRPGEHAFATRALTGVRASLLVCAATSITASALLVGNVTGGTRNGLWIALTALGGVAAAAIIVSNVLPARHS